MASYEFEVKKLIETFTKYGIHQKREISQIMGYNCDILYHTQKSPSKKMICYSRMIALLTDELEKRNVDLKAVAPHLNRCRFP